MSKSPPENTTAVSKRRVFLVDDHPLVREWLTNLIDRQPDLVVCGEAETSAAAYEAIAKLRPDVAVVDLALVSASGLELVKQLQVLTPPPITLVLSMHDEVMYAERALRAGARGYVMKRAATRQVIHAIREVLQGRLYVSEILAVQMAERFVSGGGAGGETAVSQLSDREMEVFRLLGSGRGTRQIAETLSLSPKTVQVYCGRIKEKLHLANITELIREAVRWVESEHRGSL
jgi:DNA-binding NarL/FixJ family response regulator